MKPDSHGRTDGRPTPPRIPAARRFRVRRHLAWILALVPLVVAVLHLKAPVPADATVPRRTPSMTSDMPPAVLSWRWEILSQAQYEQLATDWSAYIDAHPTSAVAHVQLARAWRYAGTASAQERSALIRKAYELDPECPEALNAMADTAIHSGAPLATPEEALAYGRRAIERAPDWPLPHCNLWSVAVKLGRYDEAREHVRAFLRLGGIPSPLLDMGYNLLASAEPRAILLTNGDNDTYPPLALQAERGYRTDVAVVNLSMLNLIEYATWVFDDVYGDLGPFTDQELRDLQARWKQRDIEAGERYSDVVTRALIDKVQDGRWKDPVYLAITVAQATLDCCEQTLEIEGLAWRVLPERQRGAEPERSRVNLEKSYRLLRDVFRLDSATDLTFPWTPVSAVGRAMRNYPALCQLVAAEAAEGGDLERARFAMRTGIGILEFHGDDRFLEQMVEYWRQIDPENPEIERWSNTGK